MSPKQLNWICFHRNWRKSIGKGQKCHYRVVYRPPNSDISMFNGHMSELLTKIKSERKYVSCLGDYNISLLNCDTHGPTEEFADLTHWGRVTHICVSKLTIIGSDNGLAPGRRQTIIWTYDGILLIGPLGTNFSEISIEIQTFSFKKMHLKTSSAKRRPFCLGLNVLVYPHSLFPCFTKPTRVTAKSASLIDNIFCNSDVNNDTVLMAFCTHTYQTTFRFFILITRVLQDPMFIP